MSSTWDMFTNKIGNGSLSLAEFASLLEFLREFDAANDNIISKVMPFHMRHYNYTFTTFDQLEKDVQEKGITKEGLLWFISTIHDIDHSIDQVMMYTFDETGKKKHYWKTHKSFRSLMGTFRDGKWVTRK